MSIFTKYNITCDFIAKVERDTGMPFTIFMMGLGALLYAHAWYHGWDMKKVASFIAFVRAVIEMVCLSRSPRTKNRMINCGTGLRRCSAGFLLLPLQRARRPQSCAGLWGRQSFLHNGRLHGQSAGCVLLQRRRPLQHPVRCDNSDPDHLGLRFWLRSGRPFDAAARSSGSRGCSSPLI
ncbi:hypothetical protein PENTCL1PPCAC_16369 [Pristionchus entomophagus]|uniref:Uncharacterized protein n=1 Tax=Pristionchus entomophagus TaxID=358040 RepID=A0AAV5TJ80_9BILA|nr:hypothetical protein PENTCL1PPCAC_16369 [Pristionchus entomophagus]